MKEMQAYISEPISLSLSRPRARSKANLADPSISSSESLDSSIASSTIEVCSFRLFSFS